MIRSYAIFFLFVLSLPTHADFSANLKDGINRGPVSQPSPERMEFLKSLSEGAPGRPAQKRFRPTYPVRSSGNGGDFTDLNRIFQNNANPDSSNGGTPGTEDPNKSAANGANSASGPTTGAVSGSAGATVGKGGSGSDPLAGFGEPTVGPTSDQKGKLFQDDSMRDKAPLAERVPDPNHKERSPSSRTGSDEPQSNPKIPSRMKPICFLFDSANAGRAAEIVKKVVDSYGKCDVAVIPEVFQIASGSYPNEPEAIMQMAATSCPVAAHYGVKESSIQTHTAYNDTADKMCKLFGNIKPGQCDDGGACNVAGCAELVPPRNGALSGQELEDVLNAATSNTSAGHGATPRASNNAQAQSIVDVGQSFSTAAHELQHNNGGVNRGDGHGAKVHNHGIESMGQDQTVKAPEPGGDDWTDEGCAHIVAASNDNSVKQYPWDPNAPPSAYFIPDLYVRRLDSGENFLGTPGIPPEIRKGTPQQKGDPGDPPGIARRPPREKPPADQGGVVTPPAVASLHKKKPAGAPPQNITPAKPPERPSNPVASKGESEAFTDNFFGGVGKATPEQNRFKGANDVFMDEGLEREEKDPLKKKESTAENSGSEGADRLLGSVGTGAGSELALAPNGAPNSASGASSAMPGGNPSRNPAGVDFGVSAGGAGAGAGGAGAAGAASSRSSTSNGATSGDPTIFTGNFFQAVGRDAPREGGFVERLRTFEGDE